MRMLLLSTLLATGGLAAHADIAADPIADAASVALPDQIAPPREPARNLMAAPAPPLPVSDAEAAAATPGEGRIMRVNDVSVTPVPGYEGQQPGDITSIPVGTEMPDSRTRSPAPSKLPGSGSPAEIDRAADGITATAVGTEMPDSATRGPAPTHLPESGSDSEIDRAAAGITHKPVGTAMSESQAQSQQHEGAEARAAAAKAVAAQSAMPAENSDDPPQKPAGQDVANMGAAVPDSTGSTAGSPAAGKAQEGTATHMPSATAAPKATWQPPVATGIDLKGGPDR